MHPISILTRSDSSFPLRIRELKGGPAELTFAGDLTPAFTVAIVGTRDASQPALVFAAELAKAVVSAGAIVVSGGALGIDVAAHLGALEGKGRTWLVAPCGPDSVFPTAHAALYEDIPNRGGAVIWPFPKGTQARLPYFHARNRILVALADVVVVVQAPVPSGALNAAKHARDLGRPLWAVPGPPWDPGFTGSRDLIDKGALVLTSIQRFLQGTGLDRLRKIAGPTLFDPNPPPQPTAFGASSLPPPSSLKGILTDAWTASPRRNRTRNAPALPTHPLHAAAARSRPPFAPRLSELPLLDDTERALFEATSTDPRHIDEIAARARVCTSAAATGLLTLALENVVVEGPGGFYRRGFDV